MSFTLPPLFPLLSIKLGPASMRRVRHLHRAAAIIPVVGRKLVGLAVPEASVAIKAAKGEGGGEGVHGAGLGLVFYQCFTNKNKKAPYGIARGYSVESEGFEPPEV
jgi:hypothetical protein